ncbi:MAG: hypothetical protein IJ730_06250 [Alphaproteobacteria bacterium]|nr:hypothetical protein [Alphaproteobacteria bacterium]
MLTFSLASTLASTAVSCCGLTLAELLSCACAGGIGSVTALRDYCWEFSATPPGLSIA